MANESKIGFGIIGCGAISKWHAEAILSIEDARLVGVTDTAAERASRFAEEYSCLAFSDTEEMLQCDVVDAVCICVPSGLHARYAVQAARAGKHFVVEKPLAITREDLTAVIEACEEHHVTGCVISQFRFSPAVQMVKKAIEDGLLGRLVCADLSMKYYRSPEYYASAGWRGTKAMDGGGALMNQGIHGIDLLQYLVGPVRSVCGSCKTLRHDIEVEDTASLSVEFENGAVGTIVGTTSVCSGFPRRIELNGTKGSITLTENRITLWSVDGEENPEKLNDESNPLCATHSNPTEGLPLDLHRIQIADMVDALKHHRKPLVDIYDGKQAVDLVLSAYEASERACKITLN